MTHSHSDIVIACCRDEEEIISEFISFYLDMGFDYVCLIDNGSKDRTLYQILHHPQIERVQVISDPRPGYDKRLLTYYNHFAPLATRWVFFIDVDEFIHFPHGVKKFAQELGDDINVLRLPVAEMLPDFSLTGNRPPLLCTSREAKFQRESKVVWKQGDVEKIYCGKHEVERQPYNEHQPSDIFIRHYHTRSRQQFNNKLRNRIETHLSITASEAASLSAFTQSSADQWIADSKRLLEPGGWECEVSRIEHTPKIEDRVMYDWYNAYINSETFRSFSPTIKIELNSTPYYCFSVRSYLSYEGHTAGEHLVLFHAPALDSFTLAPDSLADFQDIPLRIHSECLFGDVFKSNHCDCSHQLEDSLQLIKEFGKGIIFYLRQEGRGIGLANKIRSMAVAHNDSFYRNEVLGMPGDGRDYSLVAQVLRYLGIRQVQLISGNPAKLQSLHQNGIDVTLAPMTLQENLSGAARSEIQSKIQRGYRYLGSNQEKTES